MCIFSFHYPLPNRFKRYYKYWKPSDWKSKVPYQIPHYENKTHLSIVESELKNVAPLVFAGECRELKHQIAKVAGGQAFLLIGGDCAESFDNFSVDSVRDTYKLLLQMSLILTYGSSLPIVKIGRFAGQYAKPRSNEFEYVNGEKLPIYRGDIINGISESQRIPDPNRMLKAYHLSSQTLNILRAFSSGGFADLNRLDLWDLTFVSENPSNRMYQNIFQNTQKCIQFMRAVGVDISNPIFKTTQLYTAHECLLLPYEESLTRKDSITQEWYGCSGHLLWIGERTRQLNGSHIEFIKGINNPIGVKISENFNTNEILEMIKILNPDNELGRLMLITRMGAKNLKEKLPELIHIVKNNSLNVAWCCDPMHGNTFSQSVGDSKIKTRSFEDIVEEIIVYFEIHKSCGTYPGGIHLELTGMNVTECLGGNVQDIKEDDLIKNYKSTCDPRLNGIQALEIALLLADKLSNESL